MCSINANLMRLNTLESPNQCTKFSDSWLTHFWFVKFAILPIYHIQWQKQISQNRQLISFRLINLRMNGVLMKNANWWKLCMSNSRMTLSTGVKLRWLFKTNSLHRNVCLNFCKCPSLKNCRWTAKPNKDPKMFLQMMPILSLLKQQYSQDFWSIKKTNPRPKIQASP